MNVRNNRDDINKGSEVKSEKSDNELIIPTDPDMADDDDMPTYEPDVAIDEAVSVADASSEADNKTSVEKSPSDDKKKLSGDLVTLSEDEKVISEDISEGQTDEGLPDVFDEDGRVVVRRVRSAPNAPETGKRKDGGFLYTFLDSVRFIALGLLIGVFLIIFVIQRNDVFGNSMSPTLNEYDAVFVEMVSYRFSAPSRGDIVTINGDGFEGYDKTDNLIKRVIGLPGERVEIKDGYVYINGEVISEPYLSPGLMTYVTTEAIDKGYNNIELGPDEYYCLGDNRGGSLDSRVFGPVSEERIKSHVIAKIYPLAEIRILV